MSQLLILTIDSSACALQYHLSRDQQCATKRKKDKQKKTKEIQKETY